MIFGRCLFNSYRYSIRYVRSSYFYKSDVTSWTLPFTIIILTAKHYALIHFLTPTTRSRRTSKPLHIIFKSNCPLNHLKLKYCTTSKFAVRRLPIHQQRQNQTDYWWTPWHWCGVSSKPKPMVYSTHEHDPRQTRESTSKESKQINYPLGMRVGWSRGTPVYLTCFQAMHIAIIFCSLRSRWKMCVVCGAVRSMWYIAGHPKTRLLVQPFFNHMYIRSEGPEILMNGWIIGVRDFLAYSINGRHTYITRLWCSWVMLVDFFSFFHFFFVETFYNFIK